MNEYDKLCNSKFKLNKAQNYLADFMKTHNNLLVYHKIGSGKTCTALQISENLKKSYNIIIVTQASLIHSYYYELYGPCTNFKYMSEKHYNDISNLDKNIIEKADSKISKYYTFLSYDKYYTHKIKFNRKTLLIIDEVQNIVSQTGVRYKKLFNDINKVNIRENKINDINSNNLNNPSKLKIVLMSATPIFDNPIELLLTFNLLRPKILFDSNSSLNTVKKFIHTNVSYYRGSNPIVFPKIVRKTVLCKMTNYQYKLYNQVASENYDLRNSPITKVSQLPNNFLLGERMVSNICFPMGLSENYNLTDTVILNKLKKLSCKFYKLMKYIKINEGKSLIYTNFVNQFGINSLVKILEAYGYKNYSDYGQGSKSFAIFSGKENIIYRNEIKNIYNLSNNINGELLKIIILSPAGKEGLSFNNVKSIHILEPHWNFSRIEQVEGRGVRTCSHKMLPAYKRFVNIYLYISVLPDKKYGISTDQHIMKLCENKNKVNKLYNKLLKEYAFDCNLLKKYNNVKCKNI